MRDKVINIIFYIIVFGVCSILLFTVYDAFKPYDKLGEYNGWVIYETKRPTCPNVETIMEGDTVTYIYSSECDMYIIKTEEGRRNFFEMLDNGELNEEQKQKILNIINED